jgi:hypothetical protein
MAGRGADRDRCIGAKSAQCAARLGAVTNGQINLAEAAELARHVSASLSAERCFSASCAMPASITAKLATI